MQKIILNNFISLILLINNNLFIILFILIIKIFNDIFNFFEIIIKIFYLNLPFPPKSIIIIFIIKDKKFIQRNIFHDFRKLLFNILNIFILYYLLNCF